MSRELVSQFVRRDLAVRYHQTVMGFAWAIVNPALVVLSGLLIRYAFARLSGREFESADAIGLAVRAIPWTFFASAMTLATVSIVSHANLIAKVYFVREALPISSVLGQAVDTAIGTATVVIALLLLNFSFSIYTLWVIPIAILMMVFTAGCALLLSCANLFFRDVKYLVHVLISFGLFVTPVFFGPEALGQRGAFLMLLVPISTFIQAVAVSVAEGLSLLSTQSATVQGVQIVVWSPWHLVYLLIVSVGVFMLGLTTFRFYSSRFAESA